MKSSNYLYKDLSQNIATMPYEEALLHKIEEAEKLIKELLKVHYSKRDMTRLRDIRNAVSFNEKLIKELKEL